MRLKLNDPCFAADSEAELAFSTTAHFNAGGPIKPPYVLAICETKDGYKLSNVVDGEGNLLKSDAELKPGQKIKFIEVDGLLQATSAE